MVFDAANVNTLFVMYKFLLEIFLFSRYPVAELCRWRLHVSGAGQGGNITLH